MKTEILVQIDGMFSQAGPAERRQVRALLISCIVVLHLQCIMRAACRWMTALLFVCACVVAPSVHYACSLPVDDCT